MCSRSNVVFHPTWMGFRFVDGASMPVLTRTFGILFECCLGWWDHVLLSLLSGKEINLAMFTVVTSLYLSCIIYYLFIVIHQHNTFLQSLQVTILNCIGTFTECCKCVLDLLTHVPCFQEDFFGFPWKDDTMSQPLMAWKKKIWVISLVLKLIHLVFSPLPKVTHILT